MNRSEYLSFLFNPQEQAKMTVAKLMPLLAKALADIKENAKYYNTTWYIDQLESYRSLAKQSYATALYNSETILKTAQEQIDEINKRVYQPKADNQDDINLINSLVTRMTAEIRSNSSVSPTVLNKHKDTLSTGITAETRSIQSISTTILDKYKNTPIGAKAIIQGISDNKFDAGEYTGAYLKDALQMSMSKAEIEFEAKKAKDIEQIRQAGIASADFGTYLAVKQLDKLSAIDQEVNKLVAQAQQAEKDKQTAIEAKVSREYYARNGVAYNYPYSETPCIS